MISSVLLWLRTPSPDWAKPFGMAWESVGLWSRAMRRRKDWRAHEERCQAFLRAVMDELPQRRKAVVLGSGLALDIPLEEMARRFERIVLVDAIHLPPLRARVKALPNVALLTLDLTGALAPLSGKGVEDREPLAFLSTDDTLDLTVSALCLSQLPLLVEDYLEAHKRPDDTIGAALIRRHLDGLAGLPGRVVLLTDTVMAEVAPDGTITDSLDLLRGCVLPLPDDQWDWWVAPRGEKHRSLAYRHHVHAYRDFTAQANKATRL